jgi:hypothetical protein
MADFPIPSLRQFLMPEQTVFVKAFATPTLEQLEFEINKWVTETKSIIALPGNISYDSGIYHLALTYVPAVEGNIRA